MKKIFVILILLIISIKSIFLYFPIKKTELNDNRDSLISIELKNDEISNVYTLPIGSTLNDLIETYDIDINDDYSNYSLNSKLYNNQVISLRDNTKKYISINSATLEELITLPGIGETIAKNIIDYRVENNGFIAIEELLNVKGIGEKKYERIKEFISL